MVSDGHVDVRTKLFLSNSVAWRRNVTDRETKRVNL